MTGRSPLVECPRDAFQGLPRPLPTDRKIAHLLLLVEAGFRRIDFGSFVSPKAVPQMADSREVADALPRDRGVEWIAIVANERGAEEAASRALPVAGFPLSVNETFQRRNAGKDLAATWPMLERIAGDLRGTKTRFAVYLSMAFGNPYGEPHDPARTVVFARRLWDLGVQELSLADTVGAAGPEAIAPVYRAVAAAVPGAEVGLHLHQTPARWAAVVRAALDTGCRRFDGALGGIGGCPFAGDDLVANLPTEGLVPLLRQAGYDPGVEDSRLAECVASALELARLGGAHG
ncbi:MAG: hydroxymethylglutaryl-CoA lyase [Planctomycetaceae bacterium]